jgi:teichoic acid transport system ATP-binding protein
MALGMASWQVDEQIDSIVEFTDLGDAIHRPLRTYSSGMRARLHFAIATSVQPRILLIDEALAVGDKAFRSKSAARIDEIVSGAGTLMLVSHSMEEIKRMCARVLWVEKGELIADGPTDDVLAEYAKV